MFIAVILARSITLLLLAQVSR